jgi:hypothetical protein
MTNRWIFTIIFQEAFLKKHLFEDIGSCCQEDSVTRNLFATLANEYDVGKVRIAQLFPHVLEKAVGNTIPIRQRRVILND